MPLGDVTMIVPVAVSQVVCINVTVGAAGIGCAVMTISADASEVHPSEFVNVKLYVPGAKPDIVVLVPVPVMPPGFSVHVPVSGKPLNTLLPVGTSHVGCVTDTNVGAEGAADDALMTTLADGAEVHPSALVTVKLYVPGARPDPISVLVPVPVTPPGFIVQVPVAGKPFNITQPVATSQVGCVIVPTVGAAGAPRASLTVNGVAVDTHPSSVVVTL